MELLLQASCVDGAEGKEGVNQLAILQQFLEANDELLEGIRVQQLDGCFDDNA
jgi:hypothetical protein